LIIESDSDAHISEEEDIFYRNTDHDSDKNDGITDKKHTWN